MELDYTAIIYLRQPAEPSVRSLVEPMLKLIGGVAQVCFEPSDLFVTVQYDHQKMGLADLVRTIEDCGCPVSGVAQRAVPAG